MVERHPSMREIRIAYEELADATPDDPGAERSRKIAQFLLERFPDAPREKLGEAMVLAADISDRTAKREQLAGQRALAVGDFLAKNSYARLEEACGDLGFFGLQEVWDYVMDEAGLPPSEAHVTIEVG